jgi:hypothetical protein
MLEARIRRQAAPPYAALTIARWFIAWAEAEGEELSNLKLQKLLYYAQGHHLAERHQPLFTEQIAGRQSGLAEVLQLSAELIDGLVLVGAEVVEHDHVGTRPVGAGELAAGRSRGDQQRVMGDLDVVVHPVPGDAGRDQADRGRVAVVELKVVEHAPPPVGP